MKYGGFTEDELGALAKVAQAAAGPLRPARHPGARRPRPASLGPQGRSTRRCPSPAPTRCPRPTSSSPRRSGPTRCSPREPRPTRHGRPGRPRGVDRRSPLRDRRPAGGHRWPGSAWSRSGPGAGDANVIGRQRVQVDDGRPSAPRPQAPRSAHGWPQPEGAVAKGCTSADGKVSVTPGPADGTYLLDHRGHRRGHRHRYRLGRRHRAADPGRL